MDIACISVGHNVKDKGAANGRYNEFDFNTDLAVSIKDKIDSTLTNIKVILSNRGAGNGAATSARKINETGASIAIELHCNAYNKLVSGSEMLYWGKSKNGRRLAQLCMDKVSVVLGLPYRGIKGLDSSSRGNVIVRDTKMPCIIAESFFIDNNNDIAVATQKMDELAQAYADAIIEYFS